MAAKDKSESDVLTRKDRRSGLDRRWIKSPYKGQERRSGFNRRQQHAPHNPFLPFDPPPRDSAAMKRLLVSASLQLEAITRLLLQSGLIGPEALEQMIADVQEEYRARQEK